MTQNTRTPRTTIHRPTRSPARAFGAIALALAVALTAGTADARAGKSSSMGSRGARTHEAPAATNTAPQSAAPMERSMAQPASPGMQQQRPGMGAPAAQSGGFFSRGGFMPGLMGGLIGAGIGGMLFGSGFFDGLGSFAGILGFILQILLVVFLVRLAMRFFRNRSAGAARPMGMGNTAYAGPTPPNGPQGGPLNRDAADARYNPVGGPVGGGLGGLGGGAAAPAGRPGVRRDDVGIGPADYEAFGQTLVAVQTAYGNEDLTALRSATTPEMGSYFAEELAQNSGRGVVNKLSDVQLLQGDLAEAWREGTMEYATVAMRFSLVDVTLDRATNRVVDGDPNRPVEATELWTFTRPSGGRWLLSAIQQAR